MFAIVVATDLTSMTTLCSDCWALDALPGDCNLVHECPERANNLKVHMTESLRNLFQEMEELGFTEGHLCECLHQYVEDAKRKRWKKFFLSFRKIAPPACTSNTQ
jgi:hypothetical protein